MNCKLKELSIAFVQTLSAGTVAGAAMPAMGQTVQSLDRIEVTGSRIKRAEIEGALPVTVIERADLEASGQNTVAEVMRTMTFSTAGAFRPQSGSSAQAFSEVNLRGLGSRRTLVLVDGRRIAKSPIVGDAVDMNSIPLAVVERIEILTDGASAIYGSDAIGGVVNVILRKDFQGVALTYGETRVSGPKEGGDRDEASAIMGVSGDKGRLIMGAAKTQRDIIFARDAYGTAGGMGASSFSNNYFRTSGSFIQAVPGGCTNPNFFMAGGRCRYDFTRVSADEAELGVKSFFARGEYKVHDDWTAFMTSSVNRVTSFGRYAPVPGYVTIEPTSRGHPWHPLYPASAERDTLRTSVGQNETILLGHRFAAGGNRDTFSDTNLYDTQLGAKGRIMNADVEFGIRKSTSTYNEIGRGYVIETLARAAIANGSYNIFNPAGSSPTVIASFTATVGREGLFDQTEQFGNATIDLFKLAGGTARLFLGAEQRKEVYKDIYDSLSEGGVVLGSAGNSAAGGRKVKAFSAEAVFPITRQLEATAAVRRENYSDYGSDTSPKISLRYQPTREVLLRASVGEGFSAPTLPQLTQKPAFSTAPIIDLRHCLADGNSAAVCATNPSFQINGLVISNPALTSEKAKQWSFGGAWDVTPTFSVKADLWNTKLEDVIVNVSAQTIVNRDNGTDPMPIPAGLSITRDANGYITQIVFGSTNEGILEQRGADASIVLTPSLGKFGRLRSELAYSRMLRATRNGVFFNGSFGFPKNRATLANRWTMGSFDASWNVNMIGDHGSDTIRFVGSYVTHDVQISYITPVKGLKLILGAVNVAQKMPPLVSDIRAFNFNLYDGYGRQAYGRVKMTF